ncbi:hypothetical protein PIIN_10833, partial [Serendipita indica DSM 11827]
PNTDWTDPKALIVSYPNPQEVEFAKYRIKYHVTTCDALYTEHDDLKAKLTELKEQIETNEREILHLKAFIAPIRRLPLELLSIIIRIHVRDHLESVWGPMRDAWNAILLCHPANYHVKLAQRTQGRFEIYEVCHTEIRLERALARAGRAPLDILVDAELTYERAFAVGLLKRIETLVSTPRLRSLSLNIPQSNLVLPADFLASWDFSSLEKLSTTIEDLLKKALNTSSRLVELGAHTTALPMATKTKYIQHIRELTLSGTASPDHSQQLSGLRGLYYLNFDASLPENHPFPTICLPQIRGLKLSLPKLLWPIDCPNITHLQITQRHRHPDPPPNRISLCHLVEFVASSSAFTMKYDFLVHFEAPKLRLLDLTDTESPQWMTSRTMGNIWPAERSGGSPHSLNPSVLKLRDVSVSTKVLVRAISGLTRCVELHLIEILNTSDFFELMCQLGRKTGKKRNAFVLLPTLQVLIIEVRSSRRKGFVEKDFLDAASAFSNA